MPPLIQGVGSWDKECHMYFPKLEQKSSFGLTQQMLSY